ncbi:MAG: hypothetical protein ACK5LV_03890 [Lachnospirales bacterium]
MYSSRKDSNRASKEILAAQHRMKLQQMGAKVTEIYSRVCYVSFKVGDIDVEYVYNINLHDKIFIERIKPYPEPLDTFESELDVVEQIVDDFKKFEQAEHSHNINEFIKINMGLNKTIASFEDLYLYYNVPREDAENILNKMDEINDIVNKVKSSGQRVYFGSEPKNL